MILLLPTVPLTNFLASTKKNLLPADRSRSSPFTRLLVERSSWSLVPSPCTCWKSMEEVIMPCLASPNRGINSSNGCSMLPPPCTLPWALLAELMRLRRRSGKRSSTPNILPSLLPNWERNPTYSATISPSLISSSVTNFLVSNTSNGSANILFCKTTSNVSMSVPHSRLPSAKMIPEPEGSDAFPFGLSDPSSLHHRPWTLSLP
jgi:hypothetical protein